MAVDTLQVVKLAEAKKGFVLMPTRWLVERSFDWLARFRRLSREFERMPEVLAGLHFVVFAMPMLPKTALLLTSGASSQHALVKLCTVFTPVDDMDALYRELTTNASRIPGPISKV